jgi:hypothetical protein
MYTVKSSNIVYRSPWMTVYEDQVRKTDGAIGMFDRISVQDSSIIVPIFKDGSILMVENYRHGARTNLLELPGGLINVNEEPLVAAKRELLEETGYESNTIEYINWPNLEEFEYTRIRKLTKELAIQEIRSGNIKSAISIAAILYILGECS